MCTPTKKKYWLGPLPIICDVCHSQVGEEFVDGRTVYGPWANMCHDCFKQIGVGLGTGKGQHYKKDETGKYLKIEG